MGFISSLSNMEKLDQIFTNFEISIFRNKMLENEIREEDIQKFVNASNSFSNLDLNLDFSLLSPTSFNFGESATLDSTNKVETIGYKLFRIPILVLIFLFIDVYFVNYMC